MVATSAGFGRRKNNIQCLIEADVSRPRSLIRVHRQHSGEALSFTAYVVWCVARAAASHPEVNAFRRGGRLILLEDMTINVLIEREMDGESVPESLGIARAQEKTYKEIHEEIRAAQERKGGRLGELSGLSWVLRLVPSFLFRVFIGIASRSLSMAKRYGKIAVTAVGMFGKGASWFVPLNAGTLAVTVGGIVQRPLLVDGAMENRDFLCLTLSFDHDLVDGAPAARFASALAELLSGAEALSFVAGGDSSP